MFGKKSKRSQEIEEIKSGVTELQKNMGELQSEIRKIGRITAEQKEELKQFQENNDVKEYLEELQKNVTNTNKLAKQLKKESGNLVKGNEALLSESDGIRRGITAAYERVLSETARIKIPYRRIAHKKIRGSFAIERLIQDYDFETVLDIGCGEGIHTEEFLRAGKCVTAIDYGKSDYFLRKGDSINAIIADFNTYEFEEKFDCVWCSHVLEHQLNVNVFLKKVYSLLKDGGVLAISVPPAKQQIVGGHVTLWNQGLLLYNLILAGFDCSESYVSQYDYDISVIVRKKPVPQEVYERLAFDVGDIRVLRDYFPMNFSYIETDKDVIFDGEQLENYVYEEGRELRRYIEEEKKSSKPYVLKRWIEITTKIGCSNNCAYCPQKKLVSTYCTNPERKTEMCFEDFKLALRHIPKWLDVCFTGMNEPFENKDAFQMVEYAVEKGYKVHVYSTLKALTRIQIEQFRNLKIKTFVIHLPDKAGMMCLEPDEEYINKLKAFDSIVQKNVKYVCIGELHPAIPKEIAEKVNCDKVVMLRAGNVLKNEKISDNLNFHPNCGRVIGADKKVICNRRLRYKEQDRKATHAEATILLPDGSVILCCQDWGLEHTLGNLYEQDYESVMYGEVMQEIEKSMFCENDKDILCRRCEYALEYDEKRWENFCQGKGYK